MKKLIIASTITVVMFFGAFVVLGINASNTPAVAQSGEATVEEEVPPFVDDVLARLVDAGILSDDLADEIRRKVPGLMGFLSPLIDEGTDPQDLDFDGYLDEFWDDFDSSDFFGSDGFTFEEFGLPDGFDLEELMDQFDGFTFPDDLENFTFEDFELPEGFVSPHDVNPDASGPGQFPGHGFGFLFDGDLLDGLSPDELRDAMENGTLEDLINTDDIISDIENMLDKAVQEGDLTREQADAKLERLTQRIESFENGEFRPFGPGGKGPHGFGGSGPHPFRPGIADDAKASA
ncbi:MAG: hypothetical protein M3132_00085 [Actinomycetia bacterium]|nr:hypothetical protein [Actinomycetes bacterium]